MNKLSEREKPLVALVSGAVIIGFSPILVRLIDISPLASAFFRVFLALPVLWMISRHTRNRQGRAVAFHPRLLIPGLLFAGDLALWHTSINYTYVANATLLANAAPLFVTLGAWWFLHETITRRYLSGLLVSIVGIAFLMVESMQISQANLWGDLAGMGTAVFYGAYLLSIRYLTRWYNTFTLMWWASLVSALCLLPMAILGNQVFWPVSWQDWLFLLILAGVAHAGGQGLITYALAHLPAGFSSVTLWIQPMVAAILAWLIFNEQLGVLQLAGMGITLTGIYLCRQTRTG